MTDVKNLLKGYRRFYRKYFTSGHKLYEGLSIAQSPKTLVIACSDSRVDPSHITNAEPGDIFVVRNVANLVPPYETGEHGQHGVSAALEFAVRVLKVQNIVVLGHSSCAGIKALVSPEDVRNTDFIGKWVEIAGEAREKVLAQGKTGEDVHTRCEKEAIRLSLENLLTFPWIRQQVEIRKLTLHGWYFSVSDGSLLKFNPQKEAFEKV